MQLVIAAENLTESAANDVLGYGLLGALLIVAAFVIRYLYLKVEALQTEKFEIYKEVTQQIATSAAAFKEVVDSNSKIAEMFHSTIEIMKSQMRRKGTDDETV